jgi:transcriptional regulator with XRE-family HTH domain
MNMMNFKDWITRKLIEYEVELGHRVTITQYAEHIGVAQSVLSQWMNGDRKPGSQKNIEKLVAVFGPEVYEVIGKETVSNYDPISEAPPEIKSRFSAALAEANQKYRDAAEEGLELSESEAELILVEAMAKYGFSDISTSPDHPA